MARLTSLGACILIKFNWVALQASINFIQSTVNTIISTFVTGIIDIYTIISKFASITGT